MNATALFGQEPVKNALDYAPACPPHPKLHELGDLSAFDKFDNICNMYNVSSLAPTRSNLIAKGMIWSPSHGDTAFTVPLFDEFMKRIMPGHDWNR